MKTAIVIGATGLVGSNLVNLLLHDSRFEQVIVFVRHTMGIQHGNLIEHIVDFDELEKWKKLITGDVLYSAMGTTLKQAGSKEEQYRIDYTYQYNVAKAAAAKGVKEYVLVSAAGSSPDATIFYSRMKGELEAAVQKLPFEAIHIMKPGMIAGERERTGELIGVRVMNIVAAIPGLAKLKPIQGQLLARSMINATFCHTSGIHLYSMGEIHKLAHR